MDTATIITLIVGFAAFGAGVLLSITLIRRNIEKRSENIIKEAQNEAEIIRKDKILQAKEHYLQLKSEHEKMVNERNASLTSNENRLRQRETVLNQRLEELKKKQRDAQTLNETLTIQLENVTKKQAELDKFQKKQIEMYETISGMSAEEAKQQLIENLKSEARSEASLSIRDIIEEARHSANLEAKKIVIETIQRTATEHAIENSVSVFPIESDEIKGRIIGREGRNIRALEAATEIEIIVDDTPEAIILSGFDPIRREVARLSLHKLVTDGRIHPARIEEVVAKTRKQVEQEIMEIGKRTCIDLGIHNMHSELMFLVGKMRYRSSYGQNLLQHSREVSNLCGIMAAELGLNTKLAKRAGLLHDIGKVADNESELPHAILGMKLAEKFKENKEVCNAVGSHHEEVEMETLLAPIVQACDAISGARPGARREVVDAYINRLKELEDIAMTYNGVTKTFAIQAGRELRVLVGAEKVSDEEAQQISFDLSKKIQETMVYPGQIKITVIRETRAVAFAK